MTCRAHRSSVAFTIAAMVSLLLLAACNGPQTVDPSPDPPTPAATAEEVAGLIARYNQRLELLDRLWARTTVRVDAPGPDGERERTQGEGYLQLIQPRSVSLSVGKYIDRMYFVLGSNDERYWWIDLLDTDAKSALVGRHELVTPELAGELGVPVHPLDLIDLLGLSPIDDDALLARVEERDGQRMLVLAMPTRLGGVREVAIEPNEPKTLGVRLLDTSGELIASSDLEMHTAARVRSGILALVPGRATLDLPTLDASVILDVSSAENMGRRPRPAPFQLDNLIERIYRIDNVIDLDSPETRSEIDRLRRS